MQVYKFRNCLLNTVERSVVKEHHHLDLTTKTFDVLQFLIENVGKVVTKDELLGTVWNGNFVEESNLPVHISKLRRSLGETKTERYIETVQGIGYRFVAPVKTVEPETWRNCIRENKRPKVNRSPNGLLFRSIAVLPFENVGADPEIEYIAEALVDGITNRLSLIPELQVIASATAFKYRGTNIDAKEVGETLGVAGVLTGRTRIAKHNIVVAIELVDVTDGMQIWGKQFEVPLNDLVKSQEEIACSVAEKIRQHPVRLPSSSPHLASGNAESHKLYLKGRYFFGKRTVTEINKAIECFRESTHLDPTNVESYAELIECYRLLYILDAVSYPVVLTKVRPFVSALSELDASNDIAYLAIAKLKFIEWKFDEARVLLEKALVINGNNIDSYFLYAELLMVLNQFSDAVSQLNRVLLLDPLSLVTYKRVARAFYRAGLHEKALDFLSVALEMEPDDYESLALLGAVWAETGEHEKALTLFRKSLLSQHSIEILSMIGYVEAAKGNDEEANRIVRELTALPGDREKHALKLARIHFALQEKETAYELLELAFQRHEIDLNALGYDPRWTAVRNEKRFRDLMLKVGLKSGENEKPTDSSVGL